MSSAHVTDRLLSAIRLCQDRHDLLFSESALLHPSMLSFRADSLLMTGTVLRVHARRSSLGCASWPRSCIVRASRLRLLVVRGCSNTCDHHDAVSDGGGRSCHASGSQQSGADASRSTIGGRRATCSVGVAAVTHLLRLASKEKPIAGRRGPRGPLHAFSASSGRTERG